MNFKIYTQMLWQLLLLLFVGAFELQSQTQCIRGCVEEPQLEILTVSEGECAVTVEAYVLIDAGSCATAQTVVISIENPDGTTSSITATDEGSGRYKYTHDYQVGDSPYTITATETSTSHVSTCSGVYVVLDEQAPVIVACAQDTTLVLNTAGQIDLPDFREELEIEDNCTYGLEVVQTPAPGTLLNLMHLDTVTVSFVVTDAGGNEAECEMDITVNLLPSVIDEQVHAQTICWNAQPAPISASAAVGLDPIFYNWQENTTDPNDEMGWSLIPGADGLTYAPGFLQQTTWYRLAVSDDGDSWGDFEASNAVEITVLDPFTPSVISMSAGGESTICFGEEPGTLEATATTGGSGPPFLYQWQISTNQVNWSNVGTASTDTPPSLTYGIGLEQDSYFRLIAFDQGDLACGSTFSVNNFLITVQEEVFAGEIGGDQTLCEGTEAEILVSVGDGSGGSGALTYQWERSLDGNNWILIPGEEGSTYAPGVLEVTTSFRRTTVSALNDGFCFSSPSNVVTVTIEDLPVAEIDQEGAHAMCFGDTHTVDGADVEVENGTILWTHDGQGILTNATTLTPTYSSVEEDAGSTVTLTLTVSSDNVCAPATATATYSIAVEDLPTASAGGSATICEDDTATVSGASASNGTILWTHNGSGTLADATTLTPTYTPGSGDAGSTVTLTMTVSSDNTCAPATATATYTLQIDDLPFVFIESDADLCPGESYFFTGGEVITGSGSVSFQWTHDGEGSLEDETTLTPTYLSSVEDAGSTVTLTLTVSSLNACAPATASAVFMIEVYDTLVVPVVSADQQLCYGGNPATLTATAAQGGGGSYSYQWQVSEDNGSWTDIAGAMGLSYTPPTFATQTRWYRILTTDTGNPSCGSDVASDAVQILVNDPLFPPIIDGGPLEVCEFNSPGTLVPTEATGGTGPFNYQWQSSPTGNNPWTNVTTLSPNKDYEVPNLTSSIYYRVVAFDVGVPTCGSVFSNAIFIEVIPDTEDPVITVCPTDREVDIDADCEWTVGDYTGEIEATDNCSTDFTIVQTPAPGTVVTLEHDEILTIGFEVSDTGGNSATCTMEITGQDVTAPTLVDCNSSTLIELGNDPWRLYSGL
jgi:hypothetical protein